MQKAQTKRWLKNEYGVALRAGLEEELEQVCASATMVLSRELSDACAALLEEHEDALVRGVLDGERLAPCYAAIAGCTAGTVGAAVERFKRDVRSAPKPTDAERFTGRRRGAARGRRHLRQRRAARVVVDARDALLVGRRARRPAHRRHQRLVGGILSLSLIHI